MDEDFFDTSSEALGEIELSENRVKVGESFGLTDNDPSLHNLVVGAGWDINVFDSETIDVDLSVFLLNAKDETREDSDFIFYNAPEGCGGAVRHTGDSRTGAGDGDDETVKIDLHGVPFDVVQIMFVLSIYKGEEKDQSLGMVKNAFLRIVNDDTKRELVRYEIDRDTEKSKDTAMLVAVMEREGPKWHFKPIGEPVNGGLRKVAMDYGLIIINQ